ncbi:hypothetical protein [Streptomyces sp. NPDC056105]|uniref:MmyB family transcriptional regulator n=1 Tax=Streptomyces sp. NPDC056105 TaxID=3345714 RepID=UPI0035E3593D
MPATLALRLDELHVQLSRSPTSGAGLDPRPAAALVDELASPRGALRRPARRRLLPAPSHRCGRRRAPRGGTLRLAYKELAMPEADGRRLVVHLPADDATTAALDRLDGRRPGALRAVNG